MIQAPEFSHRTREVALQRMQREEFDLLIVGGGITGVACAREASLRGWKVALVERSDLAAGTSSKSSKLIHGGLRYLERLEFGLVHEALTERAILLKEVPQWVRPIEFFWPIYRGDRVPKWKLRLGLFLYDLLALFRSPRMHRSWSREKLLQACPQLKVDGLVGGLSYSDATMWDDGLVIETARQAAFLGAAIATYTEAVEPWLAGDRKSWSGMKVRDTSPTEASETGFSEFSIRAKKILVTVGPWTDELGTKLTSADKNAVMWKNWIKPSKGSHLVFDLDRFPLPGAMVMNRPEDGRISFAIPRRDFTPPVVIVGTTDSPTQGDPATVGIDSTEKSYLLDLLNRYFPDLKLGEADIISTYTGVRPLMDPGGEKSLQKVSREHHIGEGPGGSVWVAGGKYTTHRAMAREILDFMKFRVGEAGTTTSGELLPSALSPPLTRTLEETVESLRHQIRNGMVLKLEDFYLRRSTLALARRDHGLPWLDRLAEVWGEEFQVSLDQVRTEVERVRRVLA